MRIVFFGTPDFAVASLKAILEAGHDVAAVVTAPDRPAGRGQKLQASAVKEFAEKQGLLILQPTNLKAEEFQDTLRSLAPEVQVVVAFRMLPEAVWDMPPKGTYNVHGSLLPDYRGAAPINWAIVNGEKETGVTTFKLKHEIDTGSILLQRSTPIGPNETAGDLYARLMDMGAELVVESLKKIESGEPELHPQSNSSDKHAPKIKREDGKVNWKASAQQVHDLVRGMTPFPGAYTEVLVDGAMESWKLGSTRVTDLKSSSPGRFSIQNGKLYVDAADHKVEVLEIQPPGKKRMSAKDLINGFRGDISDLKA